MLLPKKVAHRKVRIGKNRGNATRCNYIAFGDYGLQSLDNERITSRQIEAARQAMTRYIKRGGKIWIRIFPHTPVTKKALGLGLKPIVVINKIDKPSARASWAAVKAILNTTSPRSKPARLCSR